MLAIGDTGKLIALDEFPIGVPPVAVVYQLIVFPVEVAFRLVLPPTHILVGADGITAVGVAGRLIISLALAELVEHPPPV